MKDDKHIIHSQVIVNKMHLRTNEDKMMKLTLDTLVDGLKNEIRNSEKTVVITQEENVMLDQITFKASLVIMSIREYEYFKSIEALYKQLLEENYL